MTDNPHAHYTKPGDLPDEDAYRRGFQQGVFVALLARQLCSINKVKRWYDAVSNWRYNSTHAKRTPPPLPFDRSKISELDRRMAGIE
jgi:hypothetical protein